MPETNRGRGWVPVVGAVLLVGMVGAFIYRTVTRRSDGQTASQPTTTTAPFTQPDSRPTEPAAPKRPADLIDVARLAYPEMPTTQPLSTPLRLSEAARLVLDEPIYVGPSWRPDLWITRPDARPTRDVIADATDPEKDAQVFVTTERVVYAHWTLTEFNRSKVQLVVEKPGGGYELVSLLSRLPFPASSAGRRYEWDRAMSVDDWVAVPAGTGVSVFKFGGRQVEEQFFNLADPATDVVLGQTKPQILYAGAGSILTWLPWENGKPGGRAARYSEGAWVDLSKQAEWSAHYLHLVPLLDGSVLQLVVRDSPAAGEKAGQAVEITLTSPPRQGEAAVKEQELVDLVAKLADPDRDVRDKAFRALTRYGPSVYPTLQRLSKTAPPEAAARLQQLLRVQVRPTLGGMTLVGDRLQLVSRQPDGGAVFYSPNGVMVPQDQGSPTIESPAWIAISPGRAVELLPRYMTTDLDPAATRLWSTTSGLGFDWIVSSDTRGPRWWIGNGFAPLLRKSDSAFKEFVARDRRGRWVLRESSGEQGFNATATTTRTAETRSESSAAVPRTLLIDPSLPDPNPRLPVWEFRNATAVGWDKDNWVAASYAEGNWTLREQGWQAMKKDERMFTKREEIPPTTAPSTEPATLPATGPTSSPTTQDSAGPVLLVTNDGTRYYDGLTSLRMVGPDGRETVWPLPPEANGTGPVTLLRTADGRLFLFNQPGRVLRIKPTPGQSEPFKLEATFTRGVPTVADPTRIWLDPAGRIVLVYEDRLAVMFPLGYIPPRIQELMEPEDIEKLAE